MIELTKSYILDRYKHKIDPQESFFEQDQSEDVITRQKSVPESMKPFIFSPFSKSRMAENSQEKVWVYLDDEKEIQGPFSTIDMDQWFNEGYLDPDLLVGLNYRDRLVPLKTFLEVSSFFDNYSNISATFSADAVIVKFN